MTQTYIGIGSNVGFPIKNVEAAIEELSKIGRLLSYSSLYSTKPWGYTQQEDFVNAVARLDVSCTPQALLTMLLQIEQNMGRKRLFKWGPRVIDLDILLFGELQINTADLKIPHPGLYERAFVLVPLAEIAPNFSDDLKKLTEEAIGSVTLIKTSMPYIAK